MPTEDGRWQSPADKQRAVAFENLTDAKEESIIAITTALLDKNAPSKQYSEKLAETIVDAIVRITRVG